MLIYTSQVQAGPTTPPKQQRTKCQSVIECGVSRAVTAPVAPSRPTAQTPIAAQSFKDRGDLLVGIGANQFGRLPIGATGTTPIADPTSETGIRWGSMDADTLDGHHASDFALDADLDALSAELDDHEADTDNPHSTTANQVLPDQTGNNGKVLKTDGSTALWGTVATTDELAKISSNDTTPGYLNGKLVAGSGISLTENNDGGDETLTIAATLAGADYSEYLRMLESTIEAVLDGTLITGSNVEILQQWNFGSDASDNNAVGEWSSQVAPPLPHWTSSSAYRSASAAGAYCIIYLQCYDRDNTQTVTLSRVYAGGDAGSARVYLDDVLQGTWNQGTDATYTLTCNNGVHKIRVEQLSGTIYLGRVEYYRTPYQGKGINGDVVKVLTPLYGHTLVTTAGPGNTDNGGVFAKAVYGSDGVIHRLPMGGNQQDYSANRDAQFLSGLTATGGTSTAMMRDVPFTYYEGGHRRLTVGTEITLNTSASTRRGWVIGGTKKYGGFAYDLSASIFNVKVGAVLCEVITPGSGSNFTAGDLCVLIYTFCHSTAVATLRSLLDTDGNYCAVDLFKIAA